MKKILKSAIAVVLVLSLVLTMAACGPKDAATVAQGVDTENHVIKIGNTATISGPFAAIGVPVNHGVQAMSWYFTEHMDGYKDAEGNKYTIELVNRDDGFDAAKGVVNIEQLVETDKVFSIVSHFGSPTVTATVEYLEMKGIPMVYAASGVVELLDTESNVMTVQPIYNTEGQVLLATAVAPAPLGLDGKKIGVISTTDEAGVNLKKGIETEQEVLKLKTGTDIFYYDVDAAATDYSAAVEGLKSNGCDVVIIASAQVAYAKIAAQFLTSNYDNVDILTSYVSCGGNYQKPLIDAGVITKTRRSFATNWLDVLSEKGTAEAIDFVKILTMYEKAMGMPLAPAGIYESYDWAEDGISAYATNAYAMAGYVAGSVFVEGLARVSGEALTWEAFIAGMEESPINIPMGLSINFGEGNRKGVEALAFLEFNEANPNGIQIRPLVELAEIEASIK